MHFNNIVERGFEKLFSWRWLDGKGVVNFWSGRSLWVFGVVEACGFFGDSNYKFYVTTLICLTKRCYITFHFYPLRFSLKSDSHIPKRFLLFV